VFLEEPLEPGWIDPVLVGDQLHRAAVAERDEEVEHGYVKADRREADAAAARVEPELVADRGGERHHTAVAHHDTLGTARRARGVHHVGRVARPDGRDGRHATRVVGGLSQAATGRGYLDEPRSAAAEQRQTGLVHQGDRGSGVVADGSQTTAGMGRVERHVRTACQQHRQHGDGQRGGAPGADSNPDLGSHPAGPQPPGEPLR
jgi:hypothetical protein